MFHKLFVGTEFAKRAIAFYFKPFPVRAINEYSGPDDQRLDPFEDIGERPKLSVDAQIFWNIFWPY
jgi:hypothetical protein